MSGRDMFVMFNVYVSYSTPAACINTLSLGNIFYFYGYLNPIRNRNVHVYPNHEPDQLAWTFWKPCMVKRSWGGGASNVYVLVTIARARGDVLDNMHSRAAVQCVCEVFHTYHMHQKLACACWTPCLV